MHRGGQTEVLWKSDMAPVSSVLPDCFFTVVSLGHFVAATSVQHTPNTMTVALCSHPLEATPTQSSTVLV